jgi:hypothetical protein
VAAFYVDVNAAGESGQVGTTREAVVGGYGQPGDVSVGSYVWAVDGDDNACVALVTRTEGEWLELSMDESTWKSLDAIRNDTARSGGDRVSLHGVDPLDALRALLRTPKQD